jgi:uncharacterized protein (TIGR02246 family)
MDGPYTAAQQEVWDVVRRINAAWREGHPERLTDLFHDRMVIIGPDGRRFVEGKEPCVASYRGFCEYASVAHYRESDPQVDVYNTTAVVSYPFEIEYTIEGKVNRETGRDVFVLEKQHGRWLAVWRQVFTQPA